MSLSSRSNSAKMFYVFLSHVFVFSLFVSPILESQSVKFEVHLSFLLNNFFLKTVPLFIYWKSCNFSHLSCIIFFNSQVFKLLSNPIKKHTFIKMLFTFFSFFFPWTVQSHHLSSFLTLSSATFMKLKLTKPYI